ncbi:HAD-IIIA family hydrolase [Olivibacter ginsenosidimutans]|uniref:HAD-IIIA family hydrolase n=1 Tax=Olivibacter ginsenosidimutans TaxID=1176537 RepID=A0ABP9B153_9SPHI
MLLEKLKAVKAFAFDVDGVLTNGTVMVTEEGHQLRTFNIKDGYAIQLAIKKGYPMIVLTGGKSQGVQRRMEGLGVKAVHLGVQDKLSVFNRWLENLGITAKEVLYMGDDIPDLAIMQRVGMPVCPADAVEEIKAIAAYISPKKGGDGAVRDVLEKVLKLQQVWDNDTSVRSG